MKWILLISLLLFSCHSLTPKEEFMPLKELYFENIKEIDYSQDLHYESYAPRVAWLDKVGHAAISRVMRKS